MTEIALAKDIFYILKWLNGTMEVVREFELHHTEHVNSSTY